VVIAKNKGVAVREVPPRGDLTVREMTLHPDWSTLRKPDHFAQFYETDGFLLNSLRGFIGTGLRAGEAAIIVATQAHRDGLEERLLASGLDVAAARASGQYIVLDAAETLAKFMVNGLPEPERFEQIFAGIINQATAKWHHVRIFGEMVALLWAHGNHEATVELEILWNRLLREEDVRLFCAYPAPVFTPRVSPRVHAIRAAHNHFFEG